MKKLWLCRIKLLLILFWFFSWSQTSICSNNIKATSTTQSLVIDGYLEEAWKQADSTTAFTQVRPNQGEPLSEPTTFWILQDKEAIYFAFRCKTPGRHPDCRITGRDGKEGDNVTIYLDTFNDKRNAYSFGVTASGVQSDGIISQDGGNFDYSWDGVFYSKVMVTQEEYTVEVKIPWRQLRYNQAATEWSVNFKRSIPKNGEEGYFAPVKLEEGFRVSRFGTLNEIKPGAPGKGIELFPKGLFRYEKSYGEKENRFQPSADFNWSIKSSLRLQVTTFPDFSQIEADPFALNLSKYALFFEERREFFVEGTEYFEPSGGLMAQPLSLFYSRQVGKKLLDGSEVPIEVGSKLTGRTKKVELGLLLATTGGKEYEDFWGPTKEKKALFSVNRIKFQLLSNLTLGLFHAGKYAQKLQNDVFSLDGALLSPKIRWSYQIAQSNKDDKRDFAYTSAFFWLSPKFFLNARVQAIGDSFDVSEIGFVPWIGYRSFAFSFGPSFYPKRGMFINWGPRFNGSITRELSEKLWSRSYAISLEAYTRNNWGFTIEYNLGKEYELDTSYNPKSIYLSLLTNPTRPLLVNLFLSSSYGYNYRRSYFARSGYVYFYLYFRPSKRWSFSLMGNNWVELNPEREVEEITTRLRPGIWFAITKDMNIGVYEETVLSNKTGALSHRIGLSFSFNFLPKSWFYLALNDLETKDEGVFLPQERIVALKVKYLFFW